MSDIAAEIRDILVFHLGCREAQLTDNAKLAADLGADSLDLVEVMMSCEERFDIDIPNHVVASLQTVGNLVGCVKARIAVSAGAVSAGTESGPLPSSAPSSFRLGHSLLRYFGFGKFAGI